MLCTSDGIDVIKWVNDYVQMKIKGFARNK